MCIGNLLLGSTCAGYPLTISAAKKKCCVQFATSAAKDTTSPPTTTFNGTDACTKQPGNILAPGGVRCVRRESICST